MAIRPVGAQDPPRQALFGRERELDLLCACLREARDGRGAVVLLSGEAGAGKTAVAETLVREAAARGFLALVGHCFDLTETPPYGPWTELFSRYRASEGAPAPPPALTRRGYVHAERHQPTVAEMVRDFLAEATDRGPVLLVLEDVHWADRASLDLMRVLARDVGDQPWLFVCTYRGDELPRRHPLSILLPALQREARVVRLELQRLSAAAVRALVGAHYGLGDADAAGLAAYLYDQADGNALFTTQLLQTLEEVGTLRLDAGAWRLGELTSTPLPKALRETVTVRLVRLSDDDQALLAAAAVIGQEVPLSIWATVADRQEDSLLGTIEAAAEARLLDSSSDGDGVRFPHALIREIVYESVVPARRRTLHRRVGEALLEQPRPDPDAVALHFRRAGDPRQVEWLVRAGERAERAAALVTAADRFEAALALLDARDADPAERAWLNLRLAVLRGRQHVAEALGYVEAAARLARAAGDPRLDARTTLVRRWLLCVTGALREGLPGFAAGLAASEAIPVAEGAAAGCDEFIVSVANRGALATALAQAGRLAEARAEAERYLARPAGLAPDRASPAGRACAWESLALGLAFEGRADAARSAYASARAAALEVGDQRWVAAIYRDELVFVIVPYLAEDLALREQTTSAVTAAARRWPDTESIARLDDYTRYFALTLLELEGRWSEALRVVRVLCDGSSHALRRYIGNGVAARLARARGDAAEARERVARAWPDGPGSIPGSAPMGHALPLQRLAAELALDAGDSALARDWLVAHERWLEWAGAALGRAEAQATWARFWLVAGDPGRAYQHARRALQLASDPRQPLALLAAHRLLAELETGAARFDRADDHAQRALALATACAAPFERALALLAVAELRAAEARRLDALPAIEEAGDLLRPLEARPALDRLAALRDRLAATATIAPAYPSGLSPREVEVLRLVAIGLTNAQIAERLSISPRTVGQHLQSVYAKLGVSSRAAATHFAVTHRLA